MSKTKVQKKMQSKLEKGSDREEPGGAKPSSIDKISISKIRKQPLISKLKGKVLRLLASSPENSLEEEVDELIEMHGADGEQVSSEERSILHNVLGLSDSKVSDVMIPRADIIAVDRNIALEDFRQFIIKKEHTRMPVYKSSLDNVVGFVHIKDLISILGKQVQFDINSILREILYVPPSMKVLDLLMEMKAKRIHMALVVDEYGGTDGLVTMEDLMEEIVGEIEDEHDEIEEEEIKTISNGVLEVNARVPVEDLEKKLNVKLIVNPEDEDFDTVGGLIFFMLGHIPEIGETIRHPSGYDFEILEADPRRIKKLLVRKSA